MRSADYAFVISQVVLALLVVNLWAIDDATTGLLGALRPHFLWTLVAVELIGIASGVWQGVSGTEGRVRALVCSVCPVGLLLWWAFSAEGVHRLFVLLPASAGASLYLGPSVVGVMAGVMIGRMARRYPRMSRPGVQ